MSDLISREDAIEALTKEYMAVGILGEQWAISQCIDAIKKLPSAQRKGEWEDRDVFLQKVTCGENGVAIEEWQSARCSCCKRYHTTPYMYRFEDYNFCPNCGADMIGGKE